MPSSDAILEKSAEWGSAYLPCSLVALPPPEMDEGTEERLLVGDAMSSFSVIELSDDRKILRTVAKDSRPLWLSAVSGLREEGGESIIGADVSLAASATRSASYR